MFVGSWSGSGALPGPYHPSVGDQGRHSAHVSQVAELNPRWERGRLGWNATLKRTGCCEGPCRCLWEGSCPSLPADVLTLK